MFKKKKNKKREEQFIDDEIVVSMGDVSKTIQNKEVIQDDEIAVSMGDVAKAIQNKEAIQDDDIDYDEEWAINEEDEQEVIDELDEETDDDFEELEIPVPLETEIKEDINSTAETIEDTIDSPDLKERTKFVPKKELDDYFEEGKKKSKKLKTKKKKEKKLSKRQQKKSREFADIKDRRIFRYENKKYNKVEDFIKYLNNHYLNIDEIAKEVMNDENFYGWISKKSGVFDESLQKFKEIKEKIEK